MISFYNNAKKNKAKGVKRNRGKNEDAAQKMVGSAKSVPLLIYASEKYSQAILAVSNRSKEDLSFGIKPNTGRDFIIRAKKVKVKRLHVLTVAYFDFFFPLCRCLWKQKRLLMSLYKLQCPVQL